MPQGKLRKSVKSAWLQTQEMGNVCRKLVTGSLKQAKKADIPAMAGSLAFTTVLSIVPLIAVMFYVFKLFGGLEYAYEKLMPFLLDVLSEGTGEVVEEHIQNFVSQVQAKAVGWVGFAGLFFSAIMTYFTVVRAFGKIWEIDKPRSLQHRVIRALTLLSVGPPLLVASIVVTTAVAAQVHNIPYSGQFIAYALTTILFILVYSLVPMVKVPVRVIILGSLLPAALLESAKFFYAIYTKKMVTYSAFYGSFAAIPLFLIWIYIAWCITLFGAVWVRSLQIHFQNPKKGRI